MPLYRVGNILDMLDKVAAICITTNGFVKKGGSNVMGKGIAKSMDEKFPWLPKVIGDHIRENGNRVSWVGTGPTLLLTLPTKNAYEYAEEDCMNVIPWARDKFVEGNIVPGFYCMSRLNVIERSLKELVALVEEHPEILMVRGEVGECILPIPGCGAGGLDFKDVKPLLDKYLDDRFVVMSFKQEDFANV